MDIHLGKSSCRLVIVCNPILTAFLILCGERNSRDQRDGCFAGGTGQSGLGNNSSDVLNRDKGRGLMGKELNSRLVGIHSRATLGR